MVPADLTLSDVALARTMARTAVCRLRPDVRLRLCDDVMSDAMLGLVKAATDYDESRGLPFRQYASIRIRGEIGDGLRRIGFSVSPARRRHPLPLLAGSHLPGNDDARVDDHDDRLPVDYDNPDRQQDAEMAIAIDQAFESLDRWSFCLLPQQRQVYDLMRSGLDQRTVGVRLGLTESRISRIVAAIRLRLRAEHPVQLPWAVAEEK